MSRVECFLIVDAGVCHRYLRRHADGACSNGRTYHDAGIFLDEAPTPRTPDGYVDGTVQWPRDDSRWPTKCSHCDYVFAETDRHDLFIFDLWRRVDAQPGLFTIHPSPYAQTTKAPAGAMWFADWMSEHYRGQDGRALVVMLPDGYEWPIDGPSANNGPGWKREGAAPSVTARPSILTPGYHGFLTDGVLESC